MAAPLGKLDLTIGRSRIAIRYREDGKNDVRDLQAALWMLSQATEAVRIMIEKRKPQEESDDQ